LAGNHDPLGATPFHLNYRLGVAIETETGLATKCRAPTTVDVIGQVLDRGPTADHLADDRQRRHPGLGLRQFRRARFPRMGLTVTHKGLDLLSLFHKSPPGNLLSKELGEKVIGTARASYLLYHEILSTAIALPQLYPPPKLST